MSMSLGFIIILIVIFGYISNWLNWKYLNYRVTHYLYYIGAFVHESSHALLCLITGAHIEEYKVFTSQPHVIHTKSKWPIVGNVLISSAPIFGGLLFIFLVNHFLLGDYFNLTNLNDNWFRLLNILHWQTWIMILLLVNIGAMIGPSFQDIKNVWPALIILLFIQFPALENICFLALSLILVNIVIQLVAILGLKIAKHFAR